MRTLLIAAALILFAAPGAAAQDISRSIAIPSGGTLDLHLEVGGSLEIVASNRSDVQMTVSRSGQDAEEVQVDVDTRGDRVSVRAETSSRGSRAGASYRFQVPQRLNIEFWLSGGAVTITDVNGEIEGQTMGGDLSLSGLKGNLDVTTMGGAITLESSDVGGRVKTMGGAILLDDVSGNVDASTMGGAVSFRNVRPTGDSATRVETMGGDIEVSDAPGGADVSTMGGDIQVGKIGRYLKAQTMGGDIDADAVAGWVEANTMGGDITVKLIGGNDGDRHIELSSLGGDVDLTVPSGMSMDVDIEIQVRGEDVKADDYSVVTDFDLKMDHPRQFEGRGSNRELTIRAEGRVNGGSHKVTIRTINGNVYLRR